MPEAWRDWPIARDRPGKNARELARYVDVTHTWRLVPGDCFSPWVGWVAGANRAERLYKELLDRRIPYSNEPWNPVDHDSADTLQRVRGPSETIQGPATCLDLSLLFAGIALSADIRPFIALRTAPTLHAVVVLDLERSRSDRPQHDAVSVPPGFTQRAGEPGVWDLAPDGWSSASPSEWLIVDVAMAARARPSPSMPLPAVGARFDDAVWPELASSPKWKWTLVDVDRVRRTGLEPYPPPLGSAVPAIYGYLPQFPSFTDYPTRRDLLHELHAAVGPELTPATIVVHGESGRGKSMLAHRLAVAADHACGWFLNATDGKVLTRSLAQAERQERGYREGFADPAARGESLDQNEDRALASWALTRLRETDHPWVVVLDNCDSDPGAPGLRELIPRPRCAGQFVIITTTDARWRQQGAEPDWRSTELPPLGTADLENLGLSSAVAGAVAGRPLVAQVLAALHKQYGVALPEQAGTDGPGLAWDMLRMSHHTWPDVAELAQLLAWCPPEPVDAKALGTIGGRDTGGEAGVRLADLSFVSPSYSQGQLMIQMHRLFAAAVRHQVWRDNPAMAADMISRLLSDRNTGRGLFIEAADSKALSRLEQGEKPGEPGDVSRAADVLAVPARAGLLWYHLGHIRERRGPVSVSDAYFETALRHLDRGSHPFEVAESLIGRARVIFQDGQSSNDQLAEARALVAQGRDLLAPRPEYEARQMREQGNALSWLIARKLAGREREPQKRESKLAEVREELWLSYEERLRLIRGSASRPVERGTPPEPEDDLGAERAYYNLAGTYIELAKVHFDLAVATEQSGGRSASEQHGERIAEVDSDLVRALAVYRAVRRLREGRYGGQPHPHLAACVHGEALVAYYRATLLGWDGELTGSLSLAAEAMRQRQTVASGLFGPGNPAVLRDMDVRKSGEFMLKVTIAMLFAASVRPSAGADQVMRMAGEAVRESLGRVRWPRPDDAVGASDGRN
jgi:hypothetical protein